MAGKQQLLFGLEVDALTMTEVLQRCEQNLTSREQLQVGVVNAAKMVKLRKDRLLRESLLTCDLMLADGQSVVWASKILRRPLPERVAGIDLFERLLELAERSDRSVFLLGAKPEVLVILRQRLAERYPRLRIAGTRDGYYAAEQAAEVAEQIRASGADLLFLGMTSPKKEIFLGDYGQRMAVPIMHGVGGSFDVFAGLTKRAPASWQRFGAEWLFRLLQEPGRLWKRYLTTNSAFAWQLLLELRRPTPAYRTATDGQPAARSQQK
ncbi:MAG: WecB/TagA/CpsF family glycosyltransferase [Actinomycetota bacterium]|nr:WecB/TagA/CpsF family glycosyltransferase [Actinomycetota bacterium]MDQ2958807.1 WecB/TagA/CpsF family glycosyltransferase [Actinomycetota bacterium]